MSSPRVFQFLFEDVLGTLHQFVGTTSSTMATLAGAVGSTLFAIYVLFWGISLLKGTMQEPMMDGATRIVRGVVILAFATSAGIYSEFVVDFFWQVPGAIGAEVAAAGSSAGFTMTDDVATAQLLDAAMGEGIKAGQEAWNKATMFDIGAGLLYGIIAILTWLFVVLVCAYAGALVLMANMGLSIMLGIGPLFILCAMFESTQQLFVAWTRQLITFAVFFIVLAAAMSLTFSFFTPFLEVLNAAQAGTESKSVVVLSFAKLVAFCVVALMVLYQSTSWASGLAGGVSVTAAGAVGRAVSGFTGGIAQRNSAGRWYGAIPSATRGVQAVATSAKKAAYMRRNQIKPS